MNYFRILRGVSELMNYNSRILKNRQKFNLELVQIFITVQGTLILRFNKDYSLYFKIVQTFHRLDHGSFF